MHQVRVYCVEQNPCERLLPSLQSDTDLSNRFLIKGDLTGQMAFEQKLFENIMDG